MNATTLTSYNQLGKQRTRRGTRLQALALLIAVFLIGIHTILSSRASADQPISDYCGFATFGLPAEYQPPAADCSEAIPQTVSGVATWANPPLTITASGGRFTGWSYGTTNYNEDYNSQNIPCGNQSITVTFSRPVLSVRVQPGVFGEWAAYSSRSSSLTVSDNVGNSVTLTRASADANFPLTALTAPFPGPGISTLVFTANDGLPFTLGGLSILTFEDDCYPVKSLEMIAINSPLDTNPNAGAGQRIFPDKLTPTDAVDRKRVRIKAYTASGANKTIYFRSFDLDDPSSAASPIDPNDTSAPTGGDNRGAPTSGTMSAVGGTGATNIVSAVTDSSGIAQADLTVSMQPGDNFIVAANADLNYLNGVVVDGLNLREPFANNLLPSFRVQVTPMLTVWRKLHVEVDSMGNVSGNQATGRTSTVTPNAGINQTVIAASTSLEANRFQNGRIILNNVGSYPVIANATNTITVQGIINSVPRNTNYTVYDDDDFNSNDSAALRGDMGENVEPIQPLNMFDTTFQLVQDSDNPTQNVFAPAYIRPSYAWASGAGYNSSTVSFKLNIADTGTAIDSQLNQGRNSANNESSNFWVAYLQIGYQHEADEDNDPNGETGGATTGVGGSWSGGIDAYAGPGSIPRGTDGALIYIEVQRDTELNNGSVRLIRTVVHELGHQFALKGDDAANGFGIMSYGNDLQFVPAHLNILRWRISSPGKP